MEYLTPTTQGEKLYVGSQFVEVPVHIQLTLSQGTMAEVMVEESCLCQGIKEEGGRQALPGHVHSDLPPQTRLHLPKSHVAIHISGLTSNE